MAMGMGYEDFWHGDYCRWKYVEEAWKLQRKRENEQEWFQGRYFMDALRAVLGGITGTTPTPEYPKEPYPIFGKTEEEKNAETQRQIAEFRNQLMMLGRHFEAKEKGKRKTQSSNNKG